jgi:hypothetical protein
MNKLELLVKKLQAAKEELEKARQKMSDEYDPNDMGDDDTIDPDLEGLREFDPDEEESAGADWLKENDPDFKAEGGDEYEEYSDDEDQDAHQRSVDEDYGGDEAGSEMGLPGAVQEDRDQVAAESNPNIAREKAPQTATSPQAQEKVSGKKSRWNQPSREDLMAMRQYTRPWEQRAREANALKADPSKNPSLARHGNIIEARNQAHGDRNSAYRQLTSSDQYKNADPITQMEMDDNFEKEWHAKNPEHLKTAMGAHSEAHTKGKSAKDLHAAAKDAQIKNILTGGGHGGEGFSLEEGMQHAGGTKGDEGTQATIKQDPASSFAMGNQDFISQYAKDYANKGKKVGNIDDMHHYDEGSKRDITRILGEGPSKDPKFEKFFEHYHPLIGMNAHKTLARLGLDPKHPDIDMSMLHEAGMHGLIQAMNDYDHDNPSKASFATHAANKIRGLQMTAMKNQDAIPTEIRQAQKKFASQGAAPQPAAPKVDIKQVIGAHPKAADMNDRLARVGAARSAVKIRKGSGATKPPSGGTPSGTGGGI